MELAAELNRTVRETGFRRNRYSECLGRFLPARSLGSSLAVIGNGVLIVAANTT